MKVAMLGWEFPPFVSGGLGVHCLELTRSLARDGVEVDFYMPDVEGPQGALNVAGLYDHLRIREVPADPGTDPYGREMETYPRDFNRAVMAYNARLVDAFDSVDADVIHCHDWITVPAALELRQRTGLPLVFTVHSTEYDRSAGGFFAQQWIEDLEREGLWRADAVIAVSRYTKQLLEDRYDAAAHKIVAIHNGIDSSRFPKAASRRYEEPRGTVLFLSRLSRQKGPLFFLEAARRVLEVRPQTAFIVAGQGDMLEECIDFTLDHGIADRVRFAGFVPDDELLATYENSEVYVLPSVSEPFGITALEAMASGVPTIVSKTSGVGEDTAHILKADYQDTDEMADMMLQLLDDEVLRAELGRNGNREAKRFDWATCARKTVQAYEQAIGARRATGTTTPETTLKGDVNP